MRLSQLMERLETCFGNVRTAQNFLVARDAKAVEGEQPWHLIGPIPWRESRSNFVVKKGRLKDIEVELEKFDRRRDDGAETPDCGQQVMLLLADPGELQVPGPVEGGPTDRDIWSLTEPILTAEPLLKDIGGRAGEFSRRGPKSPTGGEAGVLEMARQGSNQAVDVVQ